MAIASRAALPRLSLLHRTRTCRTADYHLRMTRELDAAKDYLHTRYA